MRLVLPLYDNTQGRCPGPLSGPKPATQFPGLLRLGRAGRPRLRCPACAARNPLATRQPECNQTPQSTAAQSLLQLVSNALEGGLDMVLYLLLLIGVNLGSEALHKLRWAG